MKRFGALCGGLALALLAMPAASAAQEAPFVVVGGGDARTVELEPCTGSTSGARAVEEGRCPDGRPATLFGELDLAIDARVAGTLRILYARREAAKPIVLPGPANERLALIGEPVPARRALDLALAEVREGVSIRKLIRLAAFIAGHDPRKLALTRIGPIMLDVARIAVRTGTARAAALRSLGRRLSSLVRPDGASLRLDDARVEELFKLLRRAIRKPRERLDAIRDFLKETYEAATSNVRLEAVPAELRAIRLRFALPEGESFRAFEGRVLVEHTDDKEKITRVELPVGAGLPSIDAVTFEPDPVEIRCHSSLVGDDECDSADVTLTGPGVPAFVARMRTLKELPVTLSGDGEQSGAALRDVTAGSEPTRATAEVAIDEAGPPGTYKGTVRLAPGGTPPALTLDYKQRRSRWLAFWLILGGILLASLPKRFWSLRRRRDLLLAELDKAAGHYRVHADGPPKSYDLSDLIVLGGAGELKTVEELRSDIRYARNDADLDEDTGRAVEVVTRINRWLRIEPAAWRLATVVESPPTEHGPPSDLWRDTYTWNDAQAVMADARREPPDVATADAIVERVLWQTRWHHRFEAGWNAAVVPEGTPPVDPDELAALDAELKEKPVLTRSPADRAALDAQLDHLLEAVPERDRTVPGERGTHVVPGDHSLNRVNWDAASLNFRGWATLNRAEFMQFRTRVASSGRAPTRRPAQGEASGAPPAADAPRGRPAAVGQWVRGWAWRRRLMDLAWSLLLIAGATVAYLVTVYDDSWGSVDDMLTAAAAGFGAAIAIEWGALPLFQTLRLRKSA